ncbi:MAG TPA: hypothetical protein VEI97_01650, partial [bacterium]|nr:hypothetical protein [bacterium]
MPGLKLRVMDREPFVSAVVEVVPEPAVQDAGLPVEEPGGVAMQAAAMLGGADMDPGVGSGPT